MDPWWLLAGGAIFFIGVTKSGFGAGIGLAIVPIMLIACANLDMGEKAALGLMLPLLIAGDLIAVGQYRKDFLLKYIIRLGPATILGVVVASLLLWWIQHQDSEGLVKGLIRIEIGIECIVLVSLHWWRLWRGIPQKLMPEPVRSGITGGFAGISSTLAHAAGPIIAMYLLPLKLDRRAFVATTAMYFFLLNTAKVPGYYFAGQFEAVDWWVMLWAVPMVYAGAVVGKLVNKRLSDVLFTQIVYLVTFGLGWYVLVDGALWVLLDHGVWGPWGGQ